jgi:hypothetical protein
MIQEYGNYENFRKYSFRRMTDKTKQPTMKEIERFIGESAKETWREMKRYIEESYYVTPELKYGWVKYGWTVRYRKGGRSLCWLIPEKGGFTIQIILGKKESEMAFLRQEELSPSIQNFLRESKEGRDGRWLYIRLSNPTELNDVKKLLEIKRSLA